MHIYDKTYFYKKIVKKTEIEILQVIENKEKNYVTYNLQKKHGSRTISAINAESLLYDIQVELKNYLNKIPISIAAKGFKKNENYFGFLKPHINKKYYLRIDIKDFFTQIDYVKICNTLNQFIRDDRIIDQVAELCTLNYTLPQGAVTSPVVSNIVFLRTDQRILKYCQSLTKNNRYGDMPINDVVYTRYADDLLFSSDNINFKKKTFFIKTIKKILHSAGYEINYEKLKYGYEEISLSGIVIGANIRLSRKKINGLNTLLYYFDKREDISEKYRIDKSKINDKNLIDSINRLKIIGSRGEIKEFKNIQDLINYLCGYRAFLISVEQANSKVDNQTMHNHKRVKKLECIIDAIAKNYCI